MWSSLPFSAVGLAALALFVGPASAGANGVDVTPMQLRLAYAGPTGMVVSWNTYAQLSQPKVFYGRHPWLLKSTASSNVSVTYPSSTTYNNHVKITGLHPNTQYYYLPENSNTTTPYTFKTSRIAGDSTSYSIAYVADLGLIGPQGLWTTVGNGAANPLGPNDTTTVQSLQHNSDGVDFLWHGGDIAYADAWSKEEIQGFVPNTTIADGYKVYESLLNQYYDEMMPLTSTKPYM
ncbi:Purple acid phosphatase-like protein [Amanita muscaria]